MSGELDKDAEVIADRERLWRDALDDRITYDTMHHRRVNRWPAAVDALREIRDEHKRQHRTPFGDAAFRALVIAVIIHRVDTEVMP